LNLSKAEIKMIIKFLVLILSAIILFSKADDEIEFFNKMSEIICKNGGKDLTENQFDNIKRKCNIMPIVSIVIH
jgi:hypothetical protein